MMTSKTCAGLSFLFLAGTVKIKIGVIYSFTTVAAGMMRPF